MTPTSFNRRASSASVCGGAYLAEIRRRVLLSTTLLSGSASPSERVSCRFLILCPVYASLRRTASLYNTRSDALAAQRLRVSRMKALVLAKADARASSSSRSTAGAFPFPLLFPFRIGAAVGDAISTSCGERGNFLLFGVSFGEDVESVVAVNSGDGPDGPAVIGDSTMLGNLATEGQAEIGGDGREVSEFFADIASGLRISSVPVRDCEEFQPKRLIDFCLEGGL